MKILKRVLSIVLVFALVVSSATVTEAKSKFAPKTGKVTKAVKKIVPPKDVPEDSGTGADYWITPTKDCIVDVIVVNPERDGGWQRYAVASFTEAYYWHDRDNIDVNYLTLSTEGVNNSKLRLKKGVTYYIKLYQGIYLEANKTCLKYEYEYWTDKQNEEFGAISSKVLSNTEKEYKKLLKPFKNCDKCIHTKFNKEWGMASYSVYQLALVNSALKICGNDKDLLRVWNNSVSCTGAAYEAIYTKEYQKALQELYNNYLQFHKTHCK